MHQYFKNIQQLLNKVGQQEEQLKEVAEMTAKKIGKGGIIQLFGAGHSFLLAEELFYRAGGLVPVKAIYIEPLMLAAGPTTSSRNERKEGVVLAHRHLFDIRPEDIVIIISTSGRNAAPIEMAFEAKERGAFVISLQSLCYTEQESTHSSGMRLEQIVDAVFNTSVPIGDGVLQSGDYQYGASSTVVGAALLNAFVSMVIEQLLAVQQEAPVFVSNNINQSTSQNDKYCRQFENRITFN
ncbi:sugar isomerase domain-containing protein [Metasolibacillus sp. FSL H7-0170]|uniref:sugar isomerase domain-containing protein n=1 Tax=Metasolibacillus TaxID=2703677 RepID=UPI000D38C71A|nr:sugar isomerase domain-containing protein [Metasolibacillus fluoroglycofenilyticus]